VIVIVFLGYSLLYTHFINLYGCAQDYDISDLAVI